MGDGVGRFEHQQSAQQHVRVRRAVTRTLSSVAHTVAGAWCAGARRRIQRMTAAMTDLLDALVSVGAGMDVIDVGCGDGWLVRRLASRGAAVIGIEPSPHALEAARSTPPAAGERYEQGVAESLPLPDGSADVVVFFNSLHHVPVRSMAGALREAVRVCRPGGLVFVQEPLAEGPFFELMHSVEDETAVRAAAQRALHEAAASLAVAVSEHTFTPCVRVASFEAWREHQLLVAAERAPALAELDGELRERFTELGRREAGGWLFAAPARVTLLRRAGH